MSNLSFPGIGKKKPQINIPTELIDLDSENPRIVRDLEIITQDGLLKTLYDEFDLEEIAYSMTENGYFDEEPIVVIPVNLPSSIDLKIYETDVKLFESLLEKEIKKGLRFIVIEGNRRVSTAKLLTNPELKERIKISKNFPKPKNKAIENDLLILPAIVYLKRIDVSPYLGVRHIAGILKWESYAKAAYITHRIKLETDEGLSINEAIEKVRVQSGDRSDAFRKQYVVFKLLEEAEKESLEFDSKNARNRFSLLIMAYNVPSIRKYIGINSYKEVDLQKPIISQERVKELGNIFIWLFGNKNKQPPIITDNRYINDYLRPILSDEKATEYLEKHNDLFEAYNRSGGEKEYFIKLLDSAIKNIQSSLKVSYLYKNDSVVQDKMKELDEVIKAIGKSLS